MARTRSERYPDIQRNILKRAAAVFAKIGYASSTITDIAEAVELSRGALYHYFPSKDAILCAIINEHLCAYLDIIDAALKPDQASIEQLRAVTNGIVEFNTTRSPYEQVILLNEINQLSGTDRDKMKGLERQILDRVSDLLVKVDATGKITPVNKGVHTMIYFSIINYTFAWYDPNGRVKPAEYAGLAIDIFLHGLLGEKPACGQELQPATARRSPTMRKKRGTH